MEPISWELFGQAAIMVILIGVVVGNIVNEKYKGGDKK